MAGALKGITVEIDGNAKPLYQEISKINSNTKSLTQELKGVNSLLKFDPGNAELQAQKTKLLADAVSETEKKLKLLQQAEREAAAAGKDINDEGYRDLQREIVNTTRQLQNLRNEQRTFEDLQKSARSFGEKLKELASHIPGVNKLTDAFSNVKNRISETVKNSAPIKTIGTAVDTVKSKVQEFVDRHPSIQKVQSAFDKVGEAVENIKIRLPSASQAITALGNAAGNAAKTGLKALADIVEKGFKGLIEGATAAAAAVIGVGVASAKTGSQFETAMTKASTLFKDVEVDAESLNQKILKISSDTGVNAAEMGEALYSALSAGISVTKDMSEAADVLEKSAKLAKAGFTDVDTALAATAKTLNAYGLEVDAVDGIQKVLIQTQNLGITTVGELGSSLAQVTPTAASFSVSFEQVGAALAGMTAAGTPTAQATTQLNSLIAELAKNGTTAATNLQKAAAGSEYAGKSFKEMMESGATLQDVIDMLGAEAEKSGVSLVDMFSSLEAGKAALSIDGSDFVGNLKEMSTSADVVTVAYEKMSNTMQAHVQQIKTSVSNLGISLYNDMNGPLADATSLIAEMVDELQGAFSEGGFEGLAQEAGAVIAELATYIVQQTPGVFNAAFSIIQALISGLLTNMPDIVSSGITLITSVLEGMNQTLPLLAEAVPQIIGEITSALSQNLDQILTTGTIILATLINGIADTIPELSDTIVELIPVIIDSLVQNLPSIIDAGINILISLIEGITNASPQLIQAIISLIPVIVSSIMQNLPQIVQAGLNLLLALITGIIQCIPQLIEMLPQIITTIVSTLAGMLPEIIQMGILLLNTLIDGIIETIPELIAALPEIILSIVNTLIENLPEIIEAGIEILGALTAGLLKAIPELVKAVPKIIDAIWKSVTKVNWKELGSNIIKGIINGVKSAASQLINVFKDLAKDALNTVKDFFGIHSPSTVMRDQVGKMLPAGMAEGVEDGMDENGSRIEKAMRDGVPTTIDSYINAKTSGNGSGNTALEYIANGIDTINKMLPQILTATNKDIYLDSKKLVGGTVDEINRQLGRLQSACERG